MCCGLVGLRGWLGAIEVRQESQARRSPRQPVLSRSGSRVTCETLDDATLDRKVEQFHAAGAMIATMA
eukprot:13953456-Alexandrium_andersonii.AAC.1